MRNASKGREEGKRLGVGEERRGYKGMASGGTAIASTGNEGRGREGSPGERTETGRCPAARTRQKAERWRGTRVWHSDGDIIARPARWPPLMRRGALSRVPLHPSFASSEWVGGAAPLTSGPACRFQGTRRPSKSPAASGPGVAGARSRHQGGQMAMIRRCTWSTWMYEMTCMRPLKRHLQR